MSATIRRVVILLFLGSAPWACGGDDGPVSPAGSTVTLKNGTWSITRSTSYHGSDSLCAAADTLVVESQQVFCNAGAEEILGFGTYQSGPVTCTVSGNGGVFTFSCSGALEADPCTMHFSMWGSGSMSETAYDLTMDFVVAMSGPDSLCGAFAQPCTTRLGMTAEWISPQGACPTP